MARPGRIGLLRTCGRTDSGDGVRATTASLTPGFVTAQTHLLDPSMLTRTIPLGKVAVNRCDGDHEWDRLRRVSLDIVDVVLFPCGTRGISRDQKSSGT